MLLLTTIHCYTPKRNKLFKRDLQLKANPKYVLQNLKNSHILNSLVFRSLIR